jgi:hypothetical protein
MVKNETPIARAILELILLKYGKIEQIRNIIKWLKTYEETGYRFTDVNESKNDQSIRDKEKKLKADDFEKPNPYEIGTLVAELESLLQTYHVGTSLFDINYEWIGLRSRLSLIFHGERVLPERIVERIPKNE